MRATRIAAIAWATAVLLSACESRQERTYIAPLPDHIPPGSTLTLNKDLTLPENNQPLYFQDTKLLAKKALQPDDPHCEFRGKGISATAVPVAPQVLTVSGTAFDDRASSRPNEVVSATMIEMSSAGPSKRFEMTCLPSEPTPSAEFVTPEEIIGVLGDYFTLKLAQ